MVTPMIPPMKPAEFLATREGFGLTQVGMSLLLGMSVRQIIRYEAGKAPVPQPIAMLLRLMVRHKVKLPPQCFTGNNRR